MTKRTFIEEARRTQIIASAIETLAEVGYVKSSLAQIAKHAGISTSLIPYHFKDKDELMEQTVSEISAGWIAYVEAQVSTATTAQEKLQVYIEANLAYMGTRPKHFLAMLEIVFNVRNADGSLRYVVEEEDPSMILLEQLLAEGQQGGEFREFDVHNMAIVIRGAIDQFLGQMNKARADLEAYTTEIVKVFDIATRANAPKL
jgi:TetR/AcrR family transcriptional regulator, transcriptional repressor of bet genes